MEPIVHMVDVFGSGPFSGNPLAVVSGAEYLDTEQMQQLTRWFNLSETAFLLPATQPDADYRVRIFTLDRELPFAGHPTLGTAHVWATTADRQPEREAIVQECGAGLVRLRRETSGRLFFAAPALIRSGRPSPDELNQARQFLGIDKHDVVDAWWIDNGPGWLGIRLTSAEQVLALSPAASWPSRIDIGVVGPHPPGLETAFEVRAFVSDHRGSILEDPVTGSLNASIAQWLLASGVVDGSYTASQGTLLGRQGRVFIDVDDDGHVWVGGHSRAHVTGQLSL